MKEPTRFPADYTPRPRGRGLGIAHRLLNEDEYRWRERERCDRAETHIRRSKTRKLMDFTFMALYASLGVSLLVHLMNATDLLGPVWWAPFIARIPASLLWSPDPDFWVVFGRTVVKLDVFALPLYAVIHSFLIGFHRAVTYQRVFIPQ